MEGNGTFGKKAIKFFDRTGFGDGFFDHEGFQFLHPCDAAQRGCIRGRNG